MKIVKKIKIALTALSLVVLAGSALQAQKVGINTQTVPADAVLNIESGGNQGFIPPKVSTATRPSGITVGNTVYNTDVKSYQVWDGTSWSNLGTPKGAIILWSGASIPAGWALCNGNSGTPNLSGRFIVGIGTSTDGAENYTLGENGGDQTVTLSTSQIPSHTHTVDIDTDSNGSHSHNVGASFGGGNERDGVRSGTSAAGGQTTSSNGNHVHNVNGNTGSAGTGNAHENRPPYYALAYIMKL